MVNLFRYKRNYWAIILFLCLLARPVFSVDEINTGNLLTNSTFDDGSLTGWTTNNTNQYHDGFGNECVGLAVDNDSSGCGVSGSAALNGGGYIEQSVSLANDGGLTKSDINGGFKSTMSVDAWFWSGSDDQVIIRQTLVDDNGNVTIQTRIVTGTTDTVYTNGYDTYTDTIIVSENTQEDYTITARVGAVDGGGYNTGNSHNAPDIDNVTLDVTYYIPDIFETEQLEELEVETIKIIEFEEYFSVDTDTDFFEEYVIDTSMTMDEPMEMEGVTEEFNEPVAEEVPNDTYDDTGLEEPAPTMEEGPTNEESSPETFENEEEVMEEPTRDEFEEETSSQETVEESPTEEETTEETTEETENEEETKTNEEETSEETESSSEESDDSEVQAESEGEQKNIQSGTVAKTGPIKNVGGIAVKVKTVEKELSKFDKLLQQPDLGQYKEVSFYKSKNIYTDLDMSFFEQANLNVYAKDIYTGITLDTYVQNDPVEVHRVKIKEAKNKTKLLLLELEALRNENNR